MLRGNYAGEIALAVAGLPQAARSAVSLVDAGLSATGNAAAKSRIAARALARELEAAEPALAAKTPSVGPEQVRHQIGDTTPTMVREGPKITATGENVPTSKTARATPSEPCCFAPGTLVATEAGERPIETIEVGDLVWTRLEDSSGEAFLAPVTATHIRHDRPILRLSVEQVQTGEPGETTQPTIEDLLVTPGHPFYVAGQGFVSVEDLQQGDELVSLGSGKTLRVKNLVLEAPQGTTHNLTVDKGHTFFVGALGTWVHNVGPCNTCPGGVCGGGGTPVVSEVPQITVNHQNGVKFEGQVVDTFKHVGGVKNTTPITVTLPNGVTVTTIPDLLGGGLKSEVQHRWLIFNEW